MSIFQAITCKFCKKESFIKLDKPKKISKPVINLINSSQRKKRKRDKFCGLNQEVVLSLTPHNIRNLENLSESLQDRTPKLKIRKKENAKIETPVVSKLNFLENKRQMKKKNKNKNRLSELLSNATNKADRSPSFGLQDFLKSW